MPDCTRIWARVRAARFRGEVGVADRALGLGQVDQRVVERRDVGVQGRPLEGAQTPSKRRDLGDHFIHDFGRPVDVRVQRLWLHLNGAHTTAQTRLAACRCYARDANPGLLVADDAWAKLEHGPAVGDGEADVRGASGRDRQAEVQTRGVDRQRVPGAVGDEAVHRGDNIRARGVPALKPDSNAPPAPSLMTSRSIMPLEP